MKITPFIWVLLRLVRWCDSNCDGLNDYDQDGDEYVPNQYVEASGLIGGDCDDENKTVYDEL